MESQEYFCIEEKDSGQSVPARTAAGRYARIRSGHVCYFVMREDRLCVFYIRSDKSGIHTERANVFPMEAVRLIDPVQHNLPPDPRGSWFNT